MNNNLPPRRLSHGSKIKKAPSRIKSTSKLSIAIIFIVAIYSLVIAMADQDPESMKILGQNLGTIIIAVGVGIPAIIVAAFTTKYSEAQAQKQEEEKISLKKDFFSFSFSFVLFIVLNTVAFILLYSNFSDKGKIVAMMIGSLIGLVTVFLFQIAKLTK